ncbi:MAG: cation:proton antiporter [Thermoanaerobaculum sp.]|nr:cation:proton antiporter [Thermoanaerobaculum sp.]
MLGPSLLWELSLLLVAAALLGLLTQRLGQPPFLGYLLAGAVLGPMGAHLVRQRELVEQASEVGTVLLLFVLGLEFSWSRLRSFGRRVLQLGAGQLGLTFFAVGVGALLLGVSRAEAVVWAGAVTLSSTATVAKLLEQQRSLDSPQGRASLGTLLLQDLAVIPLLLAVSGMGTGGRATGPAPLLQLLAKIVFLTAVLWFSGTVLLPRLLRLLAGRQRRELQVILGFALLGLAAWAGHALSLSPALAAFVLGTLLGETEHAPQLRADVSGIKEVFLCVFFTSAGMYLDGPWLVASGGQLLALAAVVVVVKTATTYLAARMAGYPHHVALAVAFTLAQLGEFSFILVHHAAGLQLASPFTAKAVVALTVLTIALTPLAARLASHLKAKGQVVPAVSTPAPRGQVLVIGFGPAGQAVAERAMEAGLSVTVVDLNPKLAQAAARAGASALVGDATHGDILLNAGVEEALAVVVTIPDDGEAVRVTQWVAKNFPSKTVISRARHQVSVPMIQRWGAVAVGEEALVGSALAAQLLRALTQEGYPRESLRR